MEDLTQRLNQCKKPVGEPGKELAQQMNESHYELTGWALEHIAPTPEDIILDIGCGGGRTVHRLAERNPRGKVYGMDYSTDCVVWSKEYNQEYIEKGRVEILHGSVTDIPFEDETFHLVTAVETIYFWPDLDQCFREVHRILKPGGQFAVVNEMYPSEAFQERNARYQAAMNMTILTPGELKVRLEKTGFSEICIHVVEEKNWLCAIAR